MRPLTAIRADVARVRATTVLDTWQAISAELAAGTKQIDLVNAYGMSKGWVSTYASIDRMPEFMQEAIHKGQVLDVYALAALFRIHERSDRGAEAVTRFVSTNPLITRSAVRALNTWVDQS